KTTDSARTRPLPRSRRLPRERFAISLLDGCALPGLHSLRSFLDPFRSHVPVRIRAEAAVLADEHRAGFLVAFERPAEPVRRDIGELAAAGMKDGRGVAGVVAGAVERRHVVDHVER